MSPITTIALCLGWAVAIDLAALYWLHRRIQRQRRMRAEQDARDRANVWKHRPAAPRPMANTGPAPRPWVIVPENIGGTPSTTVCAEAPDTISPHATFAELVVPMEISPPEETPP